MAHQKVRKQGREDMKANIRHFISTYLFYCENSVGMDEVLYICLHFLYLSFNSCLCTFSCAIPTSLFIFNDFICVYCQRLGCAEENARHFCHVLQLSTYLIVGIVSVFHPLHFWSANIYGVYSIPQSNTDYG